MIVRTIHSKPEDIDRKWFIADVDGLVLGRVAAKIALVLRGKHKPCFSPHIDTGDFVVVVNADKVRLTGKKEEQKKYFRHTGYPGGAVFTTVAETRQKHPERIIAHAVKGMLPKGPLGRRQLKKLKIYNGSEHPHQAQQPELLKL